MTKEREIEKLEEQRARIYEVYLVSIGTALERELVADLDEIDKQLDELEGIEPEDELNTSTNWAEWELDHMIDSYREDRMLYEI